MKTTILIFLILFSVEIKAQLNTVKGCLVILADMGNEPDEMQQMIHMIACSNEFDVEGFIAVTGKYLHPKSKHNTLIIEE